MSTFKNSPNYWQGRKNFRPEAIVIHITDGAFSGALNWLTKKGSQVSAHFLTGTEGQVVQLVKISDTAWHCGLIKKSTWSLLKPNVNPNYYTIGIENEGSKNIPVTPLQFFNVATLCRQLCIDFEIPMDRDHILGHKEIRADKTCPGDFWDLEKLVRAIKYPSFNYI